MTVRTPDIYGGAAITSKNLYRQQGDSSWTEVAGAATFTADPGDVVDIVFGIGATDDDDEPYGCKYTYTVPCKSNPTLSATVCAGGGMVDYDLDTSLTVRAYDPEDGNVIALTSNEMDIDNGDVFNIKTEWQSSFEEDYGNRWCGCGNILTIKYNTTQYTNFYATDLNGNKYPGVSTPTLHSATAGYSAKSFEVPTLKSNKLWNFYLVADASGSGKDPDGGVSNVTVSLYDSNWYQDNDVTPPAIVCGVEDEDGGDIGSAGADTLTLYIVND